MRKALWFLVFALLLFTAGSLWMTKDRPDSAPGYGAAAIGGDFSLLDQDGKTARDQDFRDKLMLVTFGYTHCPDICPVSAATMSRALEILGSQSDQVSALFISVDPRRDTPPVLKDFLSNFDRHMVGLTGTEEQIKEVTANYKVYFAKVGAPWREGDSTAEHAEHGQGHGDNYLVDHSTFIYLMGKDGKYVTHFPYNASSQDVADAVKRLL